MRRLAALTVVSLLVMALPAVTAFGGTAKYADDFSEGHYSGNDGSLLFPEPWEEFGDGGTGPGGGAVHIGGENCSNNLRQ